MPGGQGRVQGKLLDATGVRQAKAETKGKTSGGLQAVGVCTGWPRASRNSGGGSHQGSRFGLLGLDKPRAWRIWGRRGTWPKF